MNFKSGDRVVLVFSGVPIQFGIILLVYAAGEHNIKVQFDDDAPGDTYYCKPEHLVLEAVYNSPLYQALQ